MKQSFRALCALAASAAFVICSAQGYETRVVARGLERPTGIDVVGYGPFKLIFFTQVPTPGVGGGRNSVDVLNLFTGHKRTLHMGEPEPLNITVSKKGDLYWTCRSAGVILERDFRSGTVSPFLTGLKKPTGIDIDRFGQVYFTQVPTPGVPGSNGGMNTVDVYTNGSIFNLTVGEPEPTDIVVSSDGTAYWTCKSAGVILQRTRMGVVSLVKGGLMKPVGIALNDRCDRLYWTEVPTPGVSGANGGRNAVRELDLDTMVTTDVDLGDPEPTDIAVANDGRIYWTCSSAGVIVEANRRH